MFILATVNHKIPSQALNCYKKIFFLSIVLEKIRTFIFPKILFDKYNIKPIIGVIPKNEDKELKSYPVCNFDFWEKIKNLKKQGWEIAMHGYEHLYDQNSKKKTISNMVGTANSLVTLMKINLRS